MPVYDLDKLRENKAQLEESIKIMEKATNDERRKLAKIEIAIEEAEKIMDSHDLQACKRGDADHDWRVTERNTDGPHRGKWKRRYCARCGEKQIVGHGNP